MTPATEDRAGDPVREEAALRAAVLAGSEAAWRLLHERAFGPVYRYVDARTGHRTSRTEDAVQETWMIAVRRIRTFDPARGRFVAWMQGVAEHVLRNLARRWRKEDARQVDLGLLAQDVSVAAGASAASVAEQVAGTLAELPESYREVLQAKYAEGLPVAAIARSSGRTVKGVESLLGRAREAFRRRFARRERKERGDG